MKKLIFGAFALLTMTASAQDWIPKTVPVVGGEFEYDQWHQQNVWIAKAYRLNYVGYVESIRDAQSLVRDAGLSYYTPASDVSIIPSYIDDEQSSTCWTAISVGSAKIIKVWNVDAHLIILLASEDEIRLAIISQANADKL